MWSVDMFRDRFPAFRWQATSRQDNFRFTYSVCAHGFRKYPRHTVVIRWFDTYAVVHVGGLFVSPQEVIKGRPEMRFDIGTGEPVDDFVQRVMLRVETAYGEPVSRTIDDLIASLMKT